MTEIQLSKIEEQNLLQEESLSKSKKLSANNLRSFETFNKSSNSISSLKEGEVSNQYDSPQIVDPNVNSNRILNCELIMSNEKPAYGQAPVSQATLAIKVAR